MPALNYQHLCWGEGQHLLEVFLEPSCPFSVKTFEKLPTLLEQIGPEQLRVQIWLHSQPWHLFSPVLVRAILAASTLTEGKEAAWQVLAAIARHREQFEFIDHCRGQNLLATPVQILQRIEQYANISLQSAFDQTELQHLVKIHTKYARQNGIHVSPTFMLNGLVQAEMSSGDTVTAWIERINSQA
jgi:protein-disulfide isomerase